MTKDKEEHKLSKFATVLSQLRKERGISQKKAATDLGISQALLSHYEKGIRECGLDFVIKCSKYYGVTTDYLPAYEDTDEGGRSIKNLALATKYLLDVSTSAINDGVGKDYVYDYYMLSVYRGALTMEKAGILPKEMFKIDYTIARDLASAAIAVQDARSVFIEDRSRTGMAETQRTALHSLIEEAEEYILSHFTY